MPSNTLLDPIQIGDMQLANRIFMAPLTRCRATPGPDAPHALQALYYAQRASAGLLISEATQISQQGKGYNNTPGIYSPEQEAGWRLTTDAVHAAGGKIIAQLWHVGRVSHSSFQPNGALPVSASAVGIAGKVTTATGDSVPFEVPRALELHEVAELAAHYAHAAKVAQRAGFDGVEIHGANSYLLEQFIRSSSNQRLDAYGGSLQNRLRVVLEVMDAVISVWGKGRVGMRLSPVSVGTSPAAQTDRQEAQASYSAVIDACNARGLAFLHMIEGATGRDRNLEGFDFAAARTQFNGATIVNNQYDQAMAEAVISSNAADAVAFGVPYISNPDLAERIANNWPWAAANKARFYGGGSDGYTDYPVYAAQELAA